MLEQAVGDAQFLAVAIDNEDDYASYAGPSYSYYEFTVRMAERLTNEQWLERIQTDKLPARPAWTGAFRAAPKPRRL